MKSFKILSSLAIFLLMLSFCVIGQNGSLTVSPEEVGIRNSDPDFTLHLTHENGSPVAGNDHGLAITNESSSTTWVIYTSSGGDLRFYRDGVPEVYFDSDGNINTLSDQAWKKNIAPMTDGQLEKLLALTPKTYQYKNSLTGKVSAGFIAQELYGVLPSVVSYIESDDDGNESWMVSHASMVPFLVKGIQEQQAIIDQQQGEIQELKRQQQEILERLAKLERE